jgi:hypothetical protein
MTHHGRQLRRLLRIGFVRDSAASNKALKLLKLVAAPVLQAEVPPRAFRRFAAVRTASQLNARVI